MEKKQKIGVLIDRLNVGGVEKIAIEEVKALRLLKIDASLVVLRRKGVVENAFPDLRKGLPTIYLDDRLPKFLTFSFKFPIFSFFSFFHVTYPFLLPFVVKKCEFDYLIVHGTYTAFTAISLRKIRGIKFSTFIWDPIGYILARAYPKNLSVFLSLFIRLANILDRLIIDNSDEVLVGGNAHNEYIKHLNPKAIIRIISPSVHPRNIILKNKKNFVLMVTAWKKGKNPEYLFDLIEKMPQIRIKMVGKWIEDQYKKEFEDKVKIRKYSANVEIVGGVTEQQLSQYYSEATVLLQTNDDKGFGMPALEAAGNGTTFIIPEGQGVCELFINKIDGFYVKEKDTKAITCNLNLLINDKKKAINMGKNAWEKVIVNYSWTNHAKSLLDIKMGL